MDKIPPGFKDFSVGSRIMVAVCVISLLLRYIVGSAVHLNATYVPKVTTRIENQVLVEHKEIKLNSLGWLFFDIVMLVGFGVLAVFITYSYDLEEFMQRSVYFIAVGLAWSAVALLCRPGDSAVAERWWFIDTFQLIITLVLIVMPWNELLKTIVLAVVYVACLFLDFCVVSRPPPPLPPEPAVPAV